MVISTTVRNSLRLIDWHTTHHSLLAGVYWWQYNSEALRSSTFKYYLDDDPGQHTEKLDRFGIPGYEWDPRDCEPSDVACSYEDTQSASLPISQAGINRPAQLFLTESYAVPAQECWLIPISFSASAIPVCYIRTERASHPSTWARP